MAVLTVEIVSRHGGEAWSGTATQVAVPLSSGDMGILPGHEPVLAVLGRGDVRITGESGEKTAVPVAGGFCSVDHDKVTVAADAAGDEVADDSVPVSDVVAEAIDVPGTAGE